MDIKETIVSIVKNMYGVEPRSYSGRNMFGEYCLGVVLDHDADRAYTPTTFLMTIALVLEQIEKVEDVCEIIDPLKESRTDQIGLDTIVYFPGIETQKDEFS